MTPERLFHELLGLGLNWEVVESQFDWASSTVILRIQETERLWESQRCPEDGALVYCYDHTQELVWRHLNVFQHKCEIHCRLPRAKCRQCGHVGRVRPPWEGLSNHFTKEFEAFALLLMREMPMAQVAQIVGETDTRLWRMLFRQLKAAYAEADFSQCCCVGVDEMQIRKGQQYISVFADLLAKRVVYACEGADQEVWTKFVEALEAHNGHRHALTQVSMDMSLAYRKGVAEHCRNAQVVYDKFHVIAQANQGVDRVRQAEVSAGGAGVWAKLKKTRWLWRKNPENLTEKQRLRMESIDQESLHTAKAYQMKRVLQDIYQEPEAGTARRRFRVWCRWVKWAAKKIPYGIFRAMVQVAQMVLRHLTGILGYWKWRVTNAYMEGMNSVFQATKRRARGYRSSEYLIAMIYLIAGKLRLPQF